MTFNRDSKIEDNDSIRYSTSTYNRLGSGSMAILSTGANPSGISLDSYPTSP